MLITVTKVWKTASRASGAIKQSIISTNEAHAATRVRSKSRDDIHQGHREYVSGCDYSKVFPGIFHCMHHVSAVLFLSSCAKRS